MLDNLHRFSPYKALMWADRIEAILKGGELPPPVIAHIYPTNVCGAECFWCIMEDEKKNHPGHIDTRLLADTLTEIAEWGVKCVHFSGGGEPTMHPDLVTFLETAHSVGLDVAISSNLQKKSSPLDAMLENCDHIRISMNAADPDTYATEMGVPGKLFDQVVDNVSALVAKRKLHGHKVDIGIAMVMNPENATSVYDFCAMGANLGVDFVHVRPEFTYEGPRGREVRAVVHTAFELAKRAKEEFGNVVKIFAMSDKFQGYWMGHGYEVCHANLMNLVIGADATLRICQDVLEPNFGDLKTTPLKEIWQSDKHREVIGAIDLKKCPRCVLENANEIIQRVFIDDEMRRFLL